MLKCAALESFLPPECGNATPPFFKTTGRRQGPELKIAGSLCSPSSWVCGTCSFVHQHLVFFSSLASMLLGRRFHERLHVWSCIPVKLPPEMRFFFFSFSRKVQLEAQMKTWLGCGEVEELLARCRCEKCCREDRQSSFAWWNTSMPCRLGKKHLKKLRPTPKSTDCTAPAESV